MSKIDPEKFSQLDRRSTMLLQAARSQVDEKGGLLTEDPGMDTLRGSFGAVGSIIRARTLRMSQSSQNTTHVRMRPTGAAAPYDPTSSMLATHHMDPATANLPRHQLYDPPVPRDDASSSRESVLSQPTSTKRPTIKFDSQDVVHSYKRPGTGDNTATHEHRQAHGSFLHDVYPPLPTTPGNQNEADLLGSSPTMARSATAPQMIPKLPPPQSLNIPPLISNEHAVQSAPPTSGRFAQSNVLGDDPFEPNLGRETWLSFPSVTDSAPSEWEGADAEREAQRMRKEKSKERFKSPKRYPRGSTDDDAEESEILFKRGTVSSQGDGDRSPTPPPDVSGIRLVSMNRREQL